jgi:hypothetical protein
LSTIARLLFPTTFNSHLSISITLCCAFAIACTFVDCYTSICTFVDGYTSTSMTFSSPASFYIIYASIKCRSITLTSFDSSMNIGSINVVPSLSYFFARQRLLLLCKNSTTYVLVVSISWFIICVNCIFSLYIFHFTHSKDDDECGGDLISHAPKSLISPKLGLSHSSCGNAGDSGHAPSFQH